MSIHPDELARLPLIRLRDLVRDQLQNPPLGSRRAAGAGTPVRAGVVGGGDELLVLAWSAAELTRERAAGVRLLGALGLEPGTRVANALPGALSTPGSLLLGDVVEQIGCLDVPLGEVRSEAAARQAWALVDRVEPSVLIIEPHGAGDLLQHAGTSARPWWRGIVWLQRGGWRPPPAVDGFGGWQRHWLAVPEASSFAAHSCAAGRLHPEEHVVVEIVDESNGMALPAGAAGSLALTAAQSEAPLYRYLTGVRARALDRCACGAAGIALELV